MPEAVHHESTETLPRDRPLLLVANEFFDALPVRQRVRCRDGWRERTVILEDDGLAFASGPPTGGPVAAATGAILEDSPFGVAIMREVARRLAAQGGAAVVIDYGYEGPQVGDTLQAVCGHRFADPLLRPGEVDLTAHVDFATLAGAARREGCVAHPLATQGAFLRALGIDARAAALASASGRGREIAAAHRRLTSGEEMGELFKILCVTAPGWPEPAGLA